MRGTASHVEMKICDMAGVIEAGEGWTPELWRNEDGRLIIRAYCECGNRYTELELWSLVHWLEVGAAARLLGSNERCWSLRNVT